MVNKLQRRDKRVVKLERPGRGERRVTTKAGLALVQLLMRRTRLLSDVRRLLPARRDPRQGFAPELIVETLVHGLLSGGRGFSATEPLREDAPLLKLLGLRRAPSAETVEHVLKYLALETEQGAGALLDVLARQSVRLLGHTRRGSLEIEGQFVPVWADGSLLEVEGECFDALKVKDRRRGQLCVGGFVGPYLGAVDFAGEGVGEQSCGRELIERMVCQVLRPRRLMPRALIVLDSLFGDGTVLDQIESYRERPAYVIGAQKLAAAEAAMQELPEQTWRDTGAQPKRRWAASGVAQAWLQCQCWPDKRLIVCRRWQREGELFWNYAAVLTNLRPEDKRIKKLMRQWGTGFEETVWRLYARKQAMENQWKDLLVDLGLHHPPCAKARVNALFYAAAALAYNLAVGVRLLGLEQDDQTMRLWRLRREWFDVAGYVVEHGRRVIVRLLTACDERIDRLLAAMARLARCC